MKNKNPSVMRKIKIDAIAVQSIEEDALDMLRKSFE